MNSTVTSPATELGILLTVKDLMNIFRQSRSTIEKHYKEHGLPSVKLGNEVRFRLVDVERFIEKNTQCQFNPSGCATCPCRNNCCYRKASQN